MADYPMAEVLAEAKRLIDQGHLVFQKWTCAFCGERITMDAPNQFYAKGRHDDCDVNPHGETDIEATGCNYLLMQGLTSQGQDLLKDLGLG